MREGQPVGQSVLESGVNIAVGGLISTLTQAFTFPLFGIYVPLMANFWLVFIFTVLSFVRSYLLRRLFNAAWMRDRL